MSKDAAKKSTLLERLLDDVAWVSVERRKIELLELLMEEAHATAGEDGSDLVARLIERFAYVTRDEYDDLISDISQYIAEHFDLERTAICATTADRNKDSAQLILYDLTTSFAQLGFFKVRALNRYDAIIREPASYDDVILVDEFIGTGRTMMGRVTRIGQLFRDKGIVAPSIHAIALAGMTRTLQSIRHNFESLNVCLPLQMGIAQLAEPGHVSHEYRIMSCLEDTLAPVSNDEKLPRLGYGQSEALFSRNRGSCPNNVFPIFWWPELLGGRPRQPLFPRAM